MWKAFQKEKNENGDEWNGSDSRSLGTGSERNTLEESVLRWSTTAALISLDGQFCVVDTIKTSSQKEIMVCFGFLDYVFMVVKSLTKINIRVVFTGARLVRCAHVRINSDSKTFCFYCFERRCCDHCFAIGTYIHRRRRCRPCCNRKILSFWTNFFYSRFFSGQMGDRPTWRSNERAIRTRTTFFCRNERRLALSCKSLVKHPFGMTTCIFKVRPNFVGHSMQKRKMTWIALNHFSSVPAKNKTFKMNYFEIGWSHHTRSLRMGKNWKRQKMIHLAKFIITVQLI